MRTLVLPNTSSVNATGAVAIANISSACADANMCSVVRRTHPKQSGLDLGGKMLYRRVWGLASPPKYPSTRLGVTRA